MTPISTIEELSRDATLVVYGRVQATEARLSNDQEYIVTDLSVIPLRVYKGRVESPDRPGRSSPVVVKRVGGTVTVEGMRLVTTVNDLPDNEVARVGEEAILFLIPDEEQPGRFVILGGSFGTMRVTTAGVSPQTRAAARRRGDTPKSFREFEQGLIAMLRK